MSIPGSYPDPAAGALKQLVTDLEPISSGPKALVVYGSLARGEYRPDDSDVNLAVVFDNATSESLEAIREPLHAASEAARIQPFVIGEPELPRLADVFPIMIDDIKRHHHLIYGAVDPFRAVSVDRADLRLQVEHELRNHLLRLRRYYLFTGDDHHQLGRAVVSSASSLVYELDALLKVVGKSPAKSSNQAVFAAAGEVFGMDEDALFRIRTFKPAEADGAGEVSELFFAAMRVVEAAVDAVDRLDNKVRGSTITGDEDEDEDQDEHEAGAES